MSENHDPEQELQKSGIEAEDGDKGEEIALNFGVVELPSETDADTVSENDSVLQSPESNQESTLSPVVSITEGVENSEQDDPDDIVVVEDAGKEDMFVDCSDELIGNADSREAVAAPEAQGSLMEEMPSDVQELQYEVEKVSPLHEVENERAALNNTILEKDNVVHEFEEERAALVQELFRLCRQLKTATNQQSLLNVTGSQLNESLNLHGIEHVEEITLVTNATLKDLVSECSQLVNRTLDERLQYEDTIGELHNNLLMKNQEIEYLNAKAVEFSMSDEAVRSYANSIEDSVKVLTEKERDTEATLDRVLTSLNSVLNQQDLLGDSISEKKLNVERNTYLLIDNYNKILLEINQLQRCLSGAESDIVFTEFGTILGSARDELIGLKAKEASNVEKLYHLEDENRRLAEELDSYRLTVKTVNAEFEKAKSELEQERTRCVNTKEKLTMAVTKGKALVQQRDALKQSLAEKGRELEEYSIELHDKSNALEAAKLIKVDLVKNENLVASLQENLLERNKVLESFENIISQLEVPRELKSMDSMEKLKWVVDEKKVLEAILLEFHKLKDTLNLSDFPDLIAPCDLKSSVSWLKESFFQAKDEIMILQDELAKTKEAAHREIDRISTLLSIELQEKYYIQEELDDLYSKHEEVIIRERQTSLEKAQIIKILQEESGMATDGGVGETSLDLNLDVYRCFQRIKEQASAAAEISSEHVESFEKVQTLLYVSHQDLILHDILLEEESSNMSDCSTRLRSVSQELREVKEENDSLQRDIQRSEEKYAMLREKLSLAVKKGKGLVQDRENMKNILDDKNTEIEKLRLQLDDLESTVADCRNQINLLSLDTQRIPQLESDLGILKDKCIQYEQFLLESNNMLQKLIESIESVVLPINIVFEEPMAKVKWIAEYTRETHDAKIRTEQELENVKEESSIMESKLGDALAAMKSFEDALSSAKKNIFQLSEEKREIESSKIHIEQELQKALDEVYTQSSKSAEASLSMSLLQESLSLAKDKISVIVKEKEEVEVCNVTVEIESKKVKEELVVQTNKLVEAQRMINILENKLTEFENNVSLLTEQNVEAQSDIEKLETERKILQESLSLAENKISMLVKEKEEAEVCNVTIEMESKTIKEELVVQTNKLAEAQTITNLLENKLTELENNVSLLTEQNVQAQNDIGKLEAERKILQESLSLAENKVSVLFKEKEKADVCNVTVEMESRTLNEEVVVQTNKLAEAHRIINELENKLVELENNVSLLTEQNVEAKSDIGKLDTDRKILQESLSLAENKISMLVKDKEEAEVCNVTVEMESRTMKEEVVVQTNKLAEAQGIINALENKLNELENNVSLLTEQNDVAQNDIGKLETERKILQESLSLAENKVSVLVKEKEKVDVCNVTVEMESKKVKKEVVVQTNNLVEAQRIINALENKLNELENNVSLLTKQNAEAQTDIGKLETEKKILQDSLSLAENKISVLVKQKEEAEVCNVTIEMESKKVKKEVVVQTNNLAEAQRIINTLENKLTELENNVSLLTEQNVEAQSGIEKLEIERKILQEEVSSQGGKVVEAVKTRKSLEDALFKAESKISTIEGERKNSENEIFALNSKLNACMEELAGTSGNLQNRSVEFAGYLNDLHKFVADETLLTVMTGCFEKKLESLREIDIILKNNRDCFVGSGIIDSHNHHVKDPYVMESFSLGKLLDFSAESESGKVVAEDDGNISSSFIKIMEGIWLKNKRIVDYIEGFSSSMDGFIADLLKKVEATREELVYVCGHVESLKEMVKNLEMRKHEQENTKVVLEDDVSLLLSACVDTTKELQFEMTDHLLLLGSIPEVDNLKVSIPMESSETNGASDVESQAKSAKRKSVAAAEQLLCASRKVRSMVKHFESTSKVVAARIQDMQLKLEMAEATTEKVREEKNLNQNMVVKLETDLQLLQNSCDDLRRQLEACQANEERLKEREAEVSSLYNSLLVKEQEDCVLSAMHMKALFEKVRRIEFPLQESVFQDLEHYDSPDAKKLFYLTDYVSELQNQLNLLSLDKQKLQSIVTTQTLTIEELKDEVDRASRDQLDSEEMNKDLSELSFSLEQITSLLGSKYSGDLESDGLKGRVKTLGRQVQDMLSESENLKIKFEELSKKLIGSQKVVDELTAKNKLLEESLQGRTSQSEIMKEKSIFEAPSFPSGSEMSEIEDAGPVGKSTKPPVSLASAAHSRSLRKGSSDHLAIDVETESSRLIGNGVEIDEEKGHVFKSLNASGLIPRHGKLIADRVDGVWVSSGRILMSRPGARLGLITYWFLIHIWLLGTIL